MMHDTLLAMASEKKSNQNIEKVQNQVYSKIWKSDVEKGIQQDKENAERVINLNLYI